MAISFLLLAAFFAADARTRAVRLPPQHILWIGAHPDDEIVLAPILARECVERRAACAMLVMTHGEAGGAPAVRSAEMQRAANLFGAALTLWTLPDVQADVEDVWAGAAGGREALVARIAAEIAARAPTVVYTFDPRHGTTCHRAHAALGALVIDALARLPAPPQLILVETFARFEAADFRFRSAVAQPIVVEAGERWAWTVRVAEIHATQFTHAQVESLSNVPAAERRVWLLDAKDAPHAIYSVACP